MFANIYTFFLTQRKRKFNSVFPRSDDPDLSIALTRSTATLSSPGLLYIIRGNCYLSKPVGNTSFLLWQLSYPWAVGVMYLGAIMFCTISDMILYQLSGYPDEILMKIQKINFSLFYAYNVAELFKNTSQKFQLSRSP